MCGLFGVYNYSGKEVKGVEDLLAALGHASAIRGTDATGISYVLDGKMGIEKSPKASYNFEFSCPDDVVAVMGHVRNTTQGSCKKNYNNHPFRGKTKDHVFSLAHNGIIYNDKTLQKQLKLPKTKIETDSYVAVQLIEKAKELSVSSVRNMAEELSGMFTITILDDTNRLWIIKNDNPMYIARFPELGMYVYASTEAILMEGCIAWWKTASAIMDTLKNKVSKLDIIEPKAGDILIINPDGSISNHVFTPTIPYSYYYNFSPKFRGADTEEYVKILSDKAITQGFEQQDVENLLEDGYSLEEITSALEYDYFQELLEEMNEYRDVYYTDTQSDEYLRVK